MSASVDRSSRMLFGENAPNWLLATLIGCGFAAAFASASLFESTPANANDRLAAALLTFSPAMALEPLPPPTVDAAPETAPAPQVEPAVAFAPVRSAPEVASNAAPECFPGFDVGFPLDSATLAPTTSVSNVEQVRRYADAHPDLKLVVEGYTDQTGAEAHNVVLSFSRAKALAAYLSTHGVSEKRISVRAAGSVGAAAPNASERDRHAHVRVEGVATCAAVVGAGETR